MRYPEVSKKRRFPAVIVVAAVLITCAGGPVRLVAQDSSPEEGRVSTATFLAVSGITEAGPPRVFDDVVVFTYEQRDFARYVAIAFEHENYQHRHVFTARRRDDRPDLYYLVYPVDVERDSVSYRLIVDGVWLTDPHAPQVTRDRNGVTVGSVELNEPPPYERTSPRIHEDGSVTFYFALDSRVSPTLETVDARQLSISSFREPRISVVGTFNGWDPYLHRLSGPGPDGFYSVRLPVPAGPHYYYFMVDGQRVLDPLNERRARDLQTDTFVSRIHVNP